MAYNPTSGTKHLGAQQDLGLTLRVITGYPHNGRANNAAYLHDHPAYKRPGIFFGCLKGANKAPYPMQFR